MIDLPSVYNPESTESKWYEVWNGLGLFASRVDRARQPFTIVIPPPNVTGALHMGHALNNSLQDALIRWRRMKGDNTLWVPGTDHGGIATQNVVERLLKKEGKTRHDLGREKFLERMWAWRRESGDTILHQLRKLGCALDWSRTRFTMDEASSRAVAAAFTELYRRGLLYRGFRLVNWCARCGTSLSDIEVEHQETKGKLWHIRYPFSTGQGDVVVATTRPETMLGDTAVAVHPEDGRYRGLAGRRIKLPLTDREIPLLADAAVDPSFGSGAVKVTPSHDAADFEIAERHELPHLMVIGYDGRITDKGGKYAGLPVKEARAAVLADLEAGGFLVKEEDHKLPVAVCYRCSTPVEPLESSQWFLKTRDMASRAARATEAGLVKIFPSSWEKPYVQWLRNNRDWCVSRQIWWGHQIPVWYCLSCGGYSPEQAAAIRRDPEFAREETKRILRESSGEPLSRETRPDACPNCAGKDLVQDPDVLDTWFSSGLWPLTTLGWPDETPDLSYYYPTSVLVTGHEILYLWVARMVMMGQEFMNKVPFGHVFIHGIVRDKQGRKMSKSLNNVIDPLDVMKKFGTDALRFALASAAVPGRDMQLSDDSFVGARNFANKIWNASRFALTNLEGYRPSDAPLAGRELADRWIRRRLAEAVRTADEAMAQYDMAQAARTLYAFFWGDFCDWYIELSKLRLLDPKEGPPADPAAKAAARQTLAETLDAALRALHPVMPYITEELWQSFCRVTQQKPAPSLLAAPAEPFPLDPAAVPDQDMREMALVMEAVTALRTLRSEMNVPPGRVIAVHASVKAPSAAARVLEANKRYVEHLAKAALRPTAINGAKPAQSATAVVADVEFFVPLEGLIDFEKERQRLRKEMDGLDADMGRLEARINNPDFAARAPKEEVEKTKVRHAEVAAQRQRLQSHLAAMGS